MAQTFRGETQRRSARARLVDRDQSVGIAERQGSQQGRIDEAKIAPVGADPKGAMNPVT